MQNNPYFLISHTNDNNNTNVSVKGRVELPSENELQELINNYRGPENFYLEFILKAAERAKELLKNDPDVYLEKHRVLPGHEGGDYNDKNVVLLTYPDHVLAHYIRSLVYCNVKDKIAYSLMNAEPVEMRRLKQFLAGQLGGKAVQLVFKELNKGFFNTEAQRERGIKGAAKNREQNTGAFDPINLQKANEAWQAKYANNRAFKEKMLNNLQQGLKTQSLLGINVFNSSSQRSKSLSYWGFNVKGTHYFPDNSLRTYLSETFVHYYVHFGIQKTTNKK